MNNDFKYLKQELLIAHRVYLETPIHRVRKLNDILLEEIIDKLHKKPNLDHFILFTNCLNFFYSTRLQAAVNKENDVLNNKNKVILRVATLLKNNWKKGLCLIDEKQANKLNPDKVERLRKLINETIDKGAYSFTTKVFHQMNNNYPIIDRNVYVFMKTEKFHNHKDFFKRVYPYGYFLKSYHEMMDKIKWSKDQVNKFDNAIWVHVDTNKAKYFKLKE